MDYIANQAGSLTAKAMNTIANLKKKKPSQQNTNTHDDLDHDATSNDNNRGNEQQRRHIGPDRSAMDGPSSSQKLVQQQLGTRIVPPASGYYRKEGGFGGDSDPAIGLPPAPPIGFKSAYMPVVGVGTASIEMVSPGGDKGHQELPQPGTFVVPVEQPTAKRNYDRLEGSFWSGSFFQRLLILTLLRLCLFIRKVYEDYEATKLFHEKMVWHSYLLSLASLFLPTLVFTIYRICRYMQTVVYVPGEGLMQLEDRPNSSGPLGPPSAGNYDQPDLRRVARSPANSGGEDGEQDGLVTARQSPMNEMYPGEASSPSPAPTMPVTMASGNYIKTSSALTPIRREPLVNATSVDDLDLMPGQETISLFMGGIAQLVHGLLFVFWQLKRQVDLISFLVIRCCIWREPRQSELLAISNLSCFSDGLEFFEDFYAGFLGVLIQVSQLATSISKRSLLEADKAKDLMAVPQEDKQFASNSDGGGLLIMSELIVSLFVVWSLLIAVRRRDDGILTFILSTIGWGAIFASRIIIIAMSILYFHYWLILLLAVHVIFMSSWIYSIALRSHNGLESDENVWRRSAEDGDDGDKNEELEEGQTDMEKTRKLQGSNHESGVDQEDVTEATETKTETFPGSTDSWSIVQHLTLISQIVALFGLPSLFYWPFMFNLKKAYRPFIYMVIIMAENFFLVLTLYFGLTNETKPVGHLYFLAIVAVTSIVGFVFLTCYVACKPKLTDQFARYDVLVNEAQTSGIYYEFCSRVFKLPDVTHSDFRRLVNQEQREEAASDC